MKDTSIRVNLPLTITDEDIDDIMSSALDYCSYWCARAEVVGDYLGDYASDQISRGGELRFYLIEEITDDGPDYFVLDKRKFLDAIAMWLDTLASYVGNVLYVGDESLGLEVGEIDGPRADSIIQLALFGEEVFA